MKKKKTEEQSDNIKNTNIKSENKSNRIGSRLEVMHGKSLQTAGGLKKSDLKLNKNGHIVSIKASDSAKNSKNLINAGYLTNKGTFGWVKKGGKISEQKKSPNKSPKKLPNKPTFF